MRAKHGIPVVAVALLALTASAPRAQPGFTTYLMGFLMRGADAPATGPGGSDLQAAHQAHLDAMWRDGLLLASGSVTDGSDVKGALIFRGDDRAAVEKRLSDDPMVKTGALRVDLGPWIGPLGVGDAHRQRVATNPGAPVAMRGYQLVLMTKVWSSGRLQQDEQLAFLRNMDAMAKAGKLAAAGPVLEGSDLAWVLIFTAEAAEVDALVAADPAVKAGRLAASRHPWMVADGAIPGGFKMP